MTTAITVRKIAHNSSAYKKALTVRNAALRLPFGLDIKHDNLTGEEQYDHFGGFEGEVLIATLYLKGLTERLAQIKQVAVDDRLRGSGVGRQLMALAEQTAKEKGYYTLCLDAKEDAIGFYERLGYHLTGVHKVIFGRTHMQMKKQIQTKHTGGLPMFQYAIVKRPCRAVIDGLTGTPGLDKPDYQKALAQHDAYVEALKQTGVVVTVLEPDENFPDSCFVEDCAVLTKECAVITRPGAATRQREIEEMVPVIGRFYQEDQIHHITAPGTLEGGDVMLVGNHFYVGASARTNAEGIRQFLEIVAAYGYTGEAVPVKAVLHLKTGVDYLAGKHLLVSGEYRDQAVFAGFEQFSVPDQEAVGVNCVWMNGKVLVPAGFPLVAEAVRDWGYEAIIVDISEFGKIDGGLSCLSLRF